MKKISIANDFSSTPGGRFNSDGAHSGQAFRDRFLLEAVKNSSPIEIDLDGVAGLPSSFLEEAFGGTFRSCPDLKIVQAKSLFIIKTSLPELKPYVTLIEKYMVEASKKNGR